MLGVEIVVGSSGCCLLLVANLVLMVLEKLLEADPPGRVGYFGLTDGAGTFAPATICGCVSTTVLGDGCGCIPLMVVVVVVVGPQRVCLSKPTPPRKGKQLAGEHHRSSGLLMLCCVVG